MKKSISVHLSELSEELTRIDQNLSMKAVEKFSGQQAGLYTSVSSQGTPHLKRYGYPGRYLIQIRQKNGRPLSPSTQFYLMQALATLIQEEQTKHPRVSYQELFNSIRIAMRIAETPSFIDFNHYRKNGALPKDTQYTEELSSILGTPSKALLNAS